MEKTRQEGDESHLPFVHGLFPDGLRAEKTGRTAAGDGLCSGASGQF